MFSDRQFDWFTIVTKILQFSYIRTPIHLYPIAQGNTFVYKYIRYAYSYRYDLNTDNEYLKKNGPISLLNPILWSKTEVYPLSKQHWTQWARK